MRRRRLLAGIAGAASLLAGCSVGDDADGTVDETVTPAPVPEENPTPVADSGVVPGRVGDAHVEALSEASARVGTEYAALVGGETLELTRTVATVDGDALTYRRFDVRALDIGGVSRIFRGLWYEGGEVVLRLFEVGGRSVYHESDEYVPPPAAERFDRERLVGTLAGFDPVATPTADGYRLSAESVANPERLPTSDRVDATVGGQSFEFGSDGTVRIDDSDEESMSARLLSPGLVPELRAEFSAEADGDPVAVTYRLSVTDRGETTVERPDASETLDWFLDLRSASPVDAETATAGENDGTGGE